MRTKNSLKNMIAGIASQILVILLGFISRKVFLDALGTEYLGVNGLLSNILSMITLIESGIGVSITYNLYKPLAEDDKEKIISLVQLYKKAYIILTIIIFVLSISIYPIVYKFIKPNERIPYLEVVFFILVLKNMIVYLNAHKWALINADQKNYMLVKVNMIFNVIIAIGKIIVLKITKSYILFLCIELILFIIQNIVNSRTVSRIYPYIKTKVKYKIDNDIKGNIIKNIKALFLHNIGTYCVFSTDNILITALVSIKSVGLYSNYSMIIAQLTSLINPIMNGISSSVGNLIVTESKEKNYEVFRVIYFINFWVYSVVVICLYNLLDPFISVWIGDEYLLDKLTLIIILVNFYLSGLRSSIGMFKVRAGIFVQDKYMPLLEAVINLGASIVLARYFGLAGIFMGTTISTLSIVFWNTPRLVYKEVFKRSVTEYFIIYSGYAILTLFTSVILKWICNLIVINNLFIAVVIKGILCLLVSNIIYIIIFNRSSEFKYILEILNNFVNLKKYNIVNNTLEGE